MRKLNKNKTQIKEKQPSDKLLLVGFLALILLHIVGGFWHSYYSWGVSYWSVLSTNTIIVSGILSIVTLFVTYYYRTKIKLEFIDCLQFSNKSKTVSSLSFILVSITLFIVLYYFRSRAHIYGDGYTILDFCSTGSTLEIRDQYYLQLLAVYWHQFFFKVLSPLGFLNQEEIFALTNVLGGVVGFVGIYKITGLLARTSKERLFFIIISLSSASIILFFGYIENYTWALSFMLWSIYYGIKYINNSCSVFPLLLFSIISFAFHMITLPILATVIYLMLYKGETTKNILLKFTRFSLVSVIIIGSLFILLISQFKGITTFVPLWKIPNNNYSLFSINHLLDILNLLLLLAPLGLLYFLFMFKGTSETENESDKTEQVLFMIFLLTFLSACVLDPQLGMIRDFDLFSFYGLPLTLWAGYRFSRTYAKEQFPTWVIVASVLIVIIHIVPNLYEKNNQNIAVKHIDKILWKDPHYQVGYKEAFCGNSWGFILKNELRRNDLAEKYFVRRLDAKSGDVQFWYDVGLSHSLNGELYLARSYFQRGFELYPQDPRFLSELSDVEFQAQNFSLAEEYARKSLVIDSNHISGLTALGIILSNRNKTDEALIHFQKAYDLNPGDVVNVLNLGIVYSRGINNDSAYYYMNKSLLFASENKKLEILASLISVTLQLNRREEAIEYLKQIKTIAPNDPLISELEKEIYGK